MFRPRPFRSRPFRSRLVPALLASFTTVVALLVAAPASAVFSEPYLYQPARGGVITDPSESAAARSLTMHYNVDNPTQDVTWELRNAEDDVVLGPYELGAKTGPASYQFVFDPTTLNAGVALPDGAYKIALTLSEGAESLTDDVTIHLAFDPPRDTTVDVLESQRDVWPGFRRYHLWVGDYTRARIVTRVAPECGPAGVRLRLARHLQGADPGRRVGTSRHRPRVLPR